VKPLLGIVSLLICYALLVTSLASSLRERPIAAKVGYVPQGAVMRFASVDHKQLVAAALMLKVLIYYGTEEDHAQHRIIRQTDFTGIERIITSLVELDPYNMDAYYFTQAIMVWDMGEYAKANKLLDYGMKFRDWDYFLPFFAGFNASYFLKDYGKAAAYYRRAGELSGADIFMRLTGRYLYQAGKTDLAIAYLKTMVGGARDRAVKSSLQRRLTALKRVKIIAMALKRYRDKYGDGKVAVKNLLTAGFLDEIPIDPYGGEYYIDKTGTVKSTSNFNFIKNEQ